MLTKRIIPCLDAVSYTHLDVYKRQEYDPETETLIVVVDEQHLK